MIKRLTASFLLAMTSAQPAWADWDDHWHHHSGGGPGDPNVDAFVSGVLLIVSASAAILFFLGPVLIIRARRIRDTLWIVPLVNLLLYLLSITLRRYPGGFAARFRPPGLWYTIGEGILLLLLTGLLILVLAIIQWTVRKIRAASGREDPATVRR
ncbi:MAG: hypothetical protein GX616_16560 [Planctomycetes bacterium]|nr:hypothetical protein [Planctomycetota bacterium]